MKPRPHLYHGIQPQWSWMRTRRDIVRSLETQTSPPGLDQTSSKFAPSPRCGVSILPGLSPSRQDICFLICKRPPMYCLCALAHDGLSGLGESVSKLWILPASPGNWCATWDGDLPTDLGWIGHSWPLPKPVREASVVSFTRWHGAPNTGPCDRNHCFIHMSMARKHRRVTLIMLNGLPLGENPVVLSHHCKSLMCRRPKVITLDGAAIRPNSFWKSFTVSDWPSLTLLTVARIVSIRAGDRCTCTVVESHTTPR